MLFSSVNIVLALSILGADVGGCLGICMMSIRKSQEKGNQRKNAQAYNEHSLRAFLMKTRQAREEKLAN